MPRISLSDRDHTQESSQHADGSAGQIIRFFHLQVKVLPSRRTHTTDTFFCMSVSVELIKLYHYIRLHCGKTDLDQI